MHISSETKRTVNSLRDLEQSIRRLPKKQSTKQRHFQAFPNFASFNHQNQHIFILQRINNLFGARSASPM